MAKRGKRPTFFLAALVGGIALVLAAQPVVASTYYVDFTNSEGTSSDSRSGLSSSAAWIHCPGDASYTGSTALKLGDIVIFKKGITYSGQISTVSSGITYTISSWGTGTAVIDGGTRDAVFQVTHSSIRIDGGSGKALKLTGSGIVHAAIWSYGNSTLTGSTFTNLVIANVGNSSSEEGIGIKIGGNTVAYTYYEISNCDILNCYSYAIKISGQGVTSIEIRSNLMEGNGYNPIGKSQVNLSSNSGGGVQNTKVHLNVIRNGAEGANGINCNNANNEIFDNEIYGNPGSGISLDPDYNSNYSGVIQVYRNKIYGQGVNGIIVGSSNASRFVKIYNNILTDNGTLDVNFSSGASNSEFVFNTLFRTKSGNGIRVQSGCNSNTLVDNVISIFQGYGIYDSTGTLIEDNNCIFRRTGSDVIVWHDAIFTSLAAYRSTSNQGSHSIWGDPKFSDTSQFNLDATSPCLGHAVSVVGIDYDYYGTRRKVVPDIGAVEHSNDSSPVLVPVAPPKRLRIQGS